MKALVYKGPRTIEFLDVPEPVPAEGFSVVRVEATGICGSDMHGYLGHDDRRPPPLILGHEAAGWSTAGAFEGQRVTINPLIACGHCRECQSGRTNICADRRILSMPPLAGTFAELVAVPDANLVAVPSGVAIEHAALSEPMAVCLHAVRLAGEMPYVSLPDSGCLILGGGAIGLGVALCLNRAGVSDICIVETNEGRRRLLEGVTRLTVCPAGSKDVNERSWDLVFDAVGSEVTRSESCRLVHPGGTIVHLGLQSGSGGFDARRATLQEICFLGTYTYTEADFREAAQAIFDGSLGPLDWLEARALSDGPKTFEDIRLGRAPHPKIILRP